ncbi:hypothetical protein D3C71_1765180 [compost metagenome]
MPAIQRLDGSSCASRPVAMAAVMAATLKACEPNGAISSEPSPVSATMGLALVLNPSLRSTSMPGMYWPVSVMRNSGKATLSNALSENAGMVKTGAASLNDSPDRSTRSCMSRKSRPSTRMPTTA